MRPLRRRERLPRRGGARRSRRPHVRVLRHRLLRGPPCRRPPGNDARHGPQGNRGGEAMTAMGDPPLLSARGLSKSYGRRPACIDIAFDLYEGEVLAVVGESGSGKSTLLGLLSAEITPTAGDVFYRMRDSMVQNLFALGEAQRRFLFRTDWGFVRQDAREGLRMGVSAGGNVGERLMAVGARHYGEIRATAEDWLTRVEVDPERIDELPTAFSGGMR